MAEETRFEQLLNDCSKNHLRIVKDILILEKAEQEHKFLDNGFQAYSDNYQNVFFKQESKKSLQDAISYIKELQEKHPILHMKHNVIESAYESGVTIQFRWYLPGYSVIVYFGDMQGCKVLENCQTKEVKELTLHPECQALLRKSL